MKGADIKLGMKVRLNNTGYEMVGGIKSREEVEAAKCMTIIDIHDTGGFPNWCGIVVDGLIGRYMLTSDCVDLISMPSTPESELTEMLNRWIEYYSDLVNSGDCGSWNPEDDGIVQDTRALLKRISK